jgi:hypothetical protein
MKEPKKRKFILANFLKNNFFSLIAFVVSFASAYFSYKSYKDTITQQAIDNSYKTFYNICITNLSNWDVNHLYTMPENYEMVKKNVHLSLMPINEKRQAEFILKELAFANFIFGTYEYTLFQYKEAEKNRDTNKAVFLKDILDFLRNKILLNPRLLYLWDSHGGNLSIYYAKTTKEDYDKNVLNNKDNPLTIKADSIGPYFIDTIKVSDSVK